MTKQFLVKIIFLWSLIIEQAWYGSKTNVVTNVVMYQKLYTIETMLLQKLDRK